ncbi:MAG: response regulator transcription factor [Sphingobacteriales bacterium]|nr:response regulator transcription factor [Sphingobacteriales bacterium]MCC7224379.1 response regulator transcription factor [Chitinophagales bacterium]
MNKGIKILLADDEPDALEFMQYNLRKEGYTVFKALNGKEAIAIAQREKPHLIVLDVMMPELDGMQTCRELRMLPDFKQTLIVFLTARSEDFSQLMGLDLGADDYLTKPIKPHLFVSKIKSLLRRYQDTAAPLPSISPNQIVRAGGIEIDKERFTVWRNGEIIELPRKEFSLLLLLASKPGKVFTRDEILLKIWGSDIIVGDRTIDVHIRKIREKLGDGHIKTLKGIGYKFDA